MEDTQKVLNSIQNRNIANSQSKKCRFCNNAFEPYYENPNATYCKDCQSQAKKEYALKMIDKSVADAGIPPRYARILTDKDIAPYKELKRGLYIHGPCGTGKTVFAASVARQALLEGRKVKFCSVVSLIMALGDRWRGKNDEPIQKWIDETVIKPDIVIFDDLGCEKVTEYVRTTIYYIFNQREAYDKISIITSNYSLEEIDAHLGCERISSRIAGNVDILHFGGVDRRIANKNK